MNNTVTAAGAALLQQGRLTAVHPAQAQRFFRPTAELLCNLSTRFGHHSLSQPFRCRPGCGQPTIDLRAKWDHRMLFQQGAHALMCFRLAIIAAEHPQQAGTYQ